MHLLTISFCLFANRDLKFIVRIKYINDLSCVNNKQTLTNDFSCESKPECENMKENVINIGINSYDRGSQIADRPKHFHVVLSAREGECEINTCKCWRAERFKRVLLFPLACLSVLSLIFHFEIYRQLLTI